jgi:hypothetical protein
VTLYSRYTGAIILSIVYGYEVKEKDDPFVAIAEEFSSLMERAIFPGELIVNTLPFRESILYSIISLS